VAATLGVPLSEDELTQRLVLFINFEQQALVMAGAPWAETALRKQLVDTPPPPAVWEKFKSTFPEFKPEILDKLKSLFDHTWSKGGEIIYDDMTSEGFLHQIIPAKKAN
jgi:hypothetical protein